MDTDSSSSKNKNSLISLKDWKLPASSASDVYNRTGFFSTVRTVEKEIRLSSNACSSFPLFSKFFQGFYKKFFSFLHVGMIQVALKPTKLGSDTSAVIYLCDKRLRDEYSILKTVDSSLSDGPIYFSYFPSYSVALCDAYHTFTIDIETEESNWMGGSESVILMYRMHYQVTNAIFPNLKRKNSGVATQSIPPSSEGEESAAANARVDWKETAEAHVLKVDVPGLKKEEVRVEVEDDGRTLKISGERSKDEEEENDGMWHCVERSSGNFLRRVTLPENAKLDEVKAAMENGVLTVTVPKEKFKKKTQLKVIEISG